MLTDGGGNHAEKSVFTGYYNRFLPDIYLKFLDQGAMPKAKAWIKAFNATCAFLSNVSVTYLKHMSLFSHPAVFTENRPRF